MISQINTKMLTLKSLIFAIENILYFAGINFREWRSLPEFRMNYFSRMGENRFLQELVFELAQNVNIVLLISQYWFCVRKYRLIIGYQWVYLRTVCMCASVCVRARVFVINRHKSRHTYSLLKPYVIIE